MRYATPAQYELAGRGESSAVIVAMGLALAVAGIVESLTGPVSQPVVAFELFVSLLVPTGLATGGYWLASRNVSRNRRWRAATRVSIGIVVACGLAAWLTVYVTLEGGTIRDPLSMTTTLAAVGGATGFVTAVREPSTVAPAEPIDSIEADGEDESPAPIDPAEPTERSPPTAEAASTPSMERPTAAAATVTAPTATAAADEAVSGGATSTVPEPTDEAATADVPAVPDSASTPARPTSGASTRTETGTAIWRHTDPEGRTAAPASPAGPEPTPTPIRDSDPSPRDEYGEFDDSRNAVDSPVPMREPGVETVAGVPTTAEAVLEVLRSERSRIALAILYHEWDGEERSVDALARAVSYHAEGDVESIATGLRHATLPELAELRAVDWDRHADRVAAPEHAVFEEGVREASVLLESFEPGTR